MLDNYQKILEELSAQSHFRSIKNISFKNGKYILLDDKKLLNLSSNNYLGLADNKFITKEFLKNGGAEFSFGSASARLLSGNLPIYFELENLLASRYSKDKALLFNSGYHANVGITSSIVGKGDVIFSDKLNHASIIDGLRLGDAKFFRYPHSDISRLEELLEKERNNYNQAVIITESIFSMDGDCSPLEKIVELKEKYDCLLIVDEAHAFGVFGDKGLGVCEHLGLVDRVDLIVGTFGKAVGSVGAFVVGKQVLIDYLINKARSFIFSTALPPINVAFSYWVIENYLAQTKDERYTMLALGERLCKELNGKDGHFSHIVPVVIGDNAKTCDVCKRLFDNGYFTLPIRPPTVPQGTSRIRLSLSADMNYKDVEILVEMLKDEALLVK